MATKKAKSAAAQELGSLGGKARAKSLTADARSQIARAAAVARWAGPRKPSPKPDTRHGKRRSSR